MSALAGLSPRERKRAEKLMRKSLNRDLKAVKKELRALSRSEGKRGRKNAHQADVIARELKRQSRAMRDRTREQRRRRAAADNVLDAIGYDALFKSGLCEVEEGIFSITLALDDINYQNSRESTQVGIQRVMSSIYNSLTSDIDFQYNLTSVPLLEDDLAGREWFPVERQGNDNLSRAAQIMNGVLNEKMKEGVSNMRRQRLVTISVPASDPDAAWRRLARLRTDISTRLEQIDCQCRLLNGAERLKLLGALVRPGHKVDFDYDRDLSVHSIMRTKDFIAPQVLDFAPNGESTYWRSDETYMQALIFRDYDNPFFDNSVASIIDLNLPMNISWHIQPFEKAEAINEMKRQQGWISKEVIDEQKKALSRGYDYNLLPPETTRSYSENKELLTDLNGQNENLLSVVAVVVTWADSTETLTENVMSIMRTGSAAGIHVELLDYFQREAMNTALPLGLSHFEKGRALTTSQVCMLTPFASQELMDEGGCWYYQNKLSGNLVLGDRARLPSPVGFISGRTGSGKGFFVKTEILGTILSKPTDRLIMIDRQGEYVPLTEYIGGTVATFGVSSASHMNPLGSLGVEGKSRREQIAFKCDALIAYASAAAEESKVPFTDEQRSILQRCIENLYMLERDEEPVLSDLCEELRAQPEPEAQKLALSFERFCLSSMDFFNHPTNISFDTQMVDLNIKDVPESMIVMALITACEAIRQQMYRNFERGIRTWLYIEEIESLFRHPSVLNYFNRLANEARKFGMYVTGISQSIESMAKNEDVAALVKNAGFCALFEQSAEDLNYWVDKRSLSPTESSFIDDGTPRGDGLLIFGGTHIPIKGDFPQDNEIYDLFSTDPNESGSWAGLSSATQDAE